MSVLITKTQIENLIQSFLEKLGITKTHNHAITDVRGLFEELNKIKSLDEQITLLTNRMHDLELEVDMMREALAHIDADTVDGKHIVVMTDEEINNLTSLDPNTIYISSLE